MAQGLLMIVLLAVFAVSIFMIAIRGLAGHKPLVVPSWVGLAILTPLTLPSVLDAVDTALTPNATLALVGALCVGGWLALLTTLWWKARGAISFYGVSERSFRNAYRQALDDLDLHADEWPTKLAIPSRDLTIQVRISTHSGFAELTSVPTSEFPFLQQLARRIRDDYVDDAPLRDRLPRYLSLGFMLVLVAFVIALYVLL